MPQLLSVFIDNRPGRLKSVTGILDEQNVNIRAFTIQDKGDSGLMKMFVDNPSDAHHVLAERGFACALKDVLVISVPDKSGNLNKLTAVMTDHDVNIADMFGFILEPNNVGVCCMELREKIGNDIKKALAEDDFKILTAADIYEL